MCRHNKYKANNFKKDLETQIFYEFKRSKLRQIKTHCVIHFEWHEENKRRDIDNVYSAKKYILDALVKFGYLENDSPKFVTNLRDDIFYDAKTSYVKVKFEEN